MERDRLIWLYKKWKFTHKTCLFYIYLLYFVRVLPLCMYGPTPICLVTTEVKRRYRISCNWSYGWFWTTAYVLGGEPCSSVRINVLHWANDQRQHFIVFYFSLLFICFSLIGLNKHLLKCLHKFSFLLLDKSSWDNQFIG